MNTEQKLKSYLAKIKKENKKLNIFIELRDENKLIDEAKAIDKKLKKGKLAGKIIAVKPNISVKGLHASCASKVLENYECTFDATVIKKIKAEDGLILGYVNCDEFACGSSGETSAFGVCQNPAALGRIPGGSSSGSAAALAADFCDMTLGSDTGGSIRNPASHCGVVGVKPTYASVSRYGLLDLSMSLDQIGTLAKNVEDAKLLLDVIKGKDENDSISGDSFRDFDKPTTNPRPPHPVRELNNRNQLSSKKISDIKNLTIGLLDISDLKVNEDIKNLVDKRVEEVAKKKGWKVKKVKIPSISLAIETYYPLVYVEFFSTTRKLDGRRYGLKIEDACGKEVLRRLLGGSEISKAEYKGRYYHLALKAKKLIEIEFARAFEKEGVDCIISPTVPRLPHKIGEKISVEDMYGYDALTIPSNLAGNCSVSVPIGKIFEKTKSTSSSHPPSQEEGNLSRSQAHSLSKIDNKKMSDGKRENDSNETLLDESGQWIPVGLQIMCDKFEDEKMLEIAKEFEL